MIQKVKLHQTVDFSRWCGRWLQESDDGQWYECYWLKLPVYDMKPVDYGYRETWCRLVLVWHGREGLMSQWIPSAKRF